MKYYFIELEIVLLQFKINVICEVERLDISLKSVAIVMVERISKFAALFLFTKILHNACASPPSSRLPLARF